TWTGRVNFRRSKSRRLRYGGGGSGVPSRREVSHGTRRSSRNGPPAAGTAATASRITTQDVGGGNPALFTEPLPDAAAGGSEFRHFTRPNRSSSVSTIFTEAPSSTRLVPSHVS